MSRNAPKPAEDRRVRRTRNRLGDALVALMQEQPFDTITVQQVLDRAGIGRSTFYLHYRDKNDLFLSDVDEFFEMMATRLSRQQDASDRVAPVRELFTHLLDVQPFYLALTASGRVHDVLDLAQGHFARGIARRLAELPRSQALAAPMLAEIGTMLAGALLSLMTAWLQRGMTEAPDEMDARYHRLAWAGVEAYAPGTTAPATPRRTADRA